MRRYILLVAARAFICAFAYPSDTTQSGRRTEQESKRQRASEQESALYSLWFDSNLFEAAAQHLCLGNMSSYWLATCGLLPGSIQCVALPWHHAVC